ncbi:MAG: hypothetical protein ACFCUM_01075 [Bacteroidales bacterium]
MRLLVLKNILVLIILSGTWTTALCQNYVPSRDDVSAFLNTKTMVVLDNNPMSMYNSWIKEAVEQNWTVTEYEFIPFSDFDKYMNDPSLSFLMTTDVFFDRDKSKARYKFLNLLLGGSARKIGDMPDLCPVPLAYLNADEDNYLYKLGVFVRFIQNHISLLQKDPKLYSSNVFKYYNDNLTSGVKDKVLYVLQHELTSEVDTKEKIENYYPGRVEIVTREQMDQAISNKDQDVIFLHKVGPEGTRLKARCYKVLIGAGDANFYFFDHHMIKMPKRPDGILATDFKRLARN